jgi:hypothetical protein
MVVRKGSQAGPVVDRQRPTTKLPAQRPPGAKPRSEKSEAKTMPPPEPSQTDLDAMMRHSGARLRVRPPPEEDERPSVKTEIVAADLRRDPRSEK